MQTTDLIANKPSVADVDVQDRRSYSSRQQCFHRGFVTPAAAGWMYVGAIAEGMRKISYAGYRFPPEVIHQAIWLYLRYTLSFRDVEDLLAERGSRSPTRPCAAG